jgi:hypothetical protein
MKGKRYDERICKKGGIKQADNKVESDRRDPSVRKRECLQYQRGFRRGLKADL